MFTNIVTHVCLHENINLLIHALLVYVICFGLGDEDINTNDTSTPTRVPVGPITRARARHINHQVSSLLSSCPSYLDHGDACTLVLVRNQGEDRKGQGFAEVEFGLQDSSNL